MVASTDIKFYVHTNNNAPQLQNAYGSMINVLDACLINGINIGAVSSLTASGTMVTALFSSSHNLMQYQVIKITGANQPEFNGEHRILTVPNAQSVTFELAAVPSATTATGTITASLPPLGWEKPFSSSNPAGGGKAAYRTNKLLLPSRPFLRVIDELDPSWTSTYAKYAKVGVVEEMTDIDTMIGGQLPYSSSSPGMNWTGTGSGTGAINGWCKWYYARSNSEYTSGAINDTYAPTDGDRTWKIIGNDEYFFICNSTVAGQVNAVCVSGFGHYKNFLAVNSNNVFLIGVLERATANNMSQKICNYNPLLSMPIATIAVFSLNSEFTQAEARSLGLDFGYGSQWYTGYSDTAGAPTVLGRIFLAPFYLKTNEGLMGEIPGVKFIPHNRPYSNLIPVRSENNMILPINTMNFSVSSTYRYGQVAFDLGALK